MAKRSKASKVDGKQAAKILRKIVEAIHKWYRHDPPNEKLIKSRTPGELLRRVAHPVWTPELDAGARTAVGLMVDNLPLLKDMARAFYCPGPLAKVLHQLDIVKSWRDGRDLGHACWDWAIYFTYPFPVEPYVKMSFKTLLKRWADEAEQSTQSIDLGGGAASKEPVAVRIAKVIRRSNPMSSGDVAKLAGTTGGTVRNSAAWKKRKNLWNVANGPPKGHEEPREDENGNADTQTVAVVDSPQAEHYDVYEMIQEYKSGKRKKPPTPEEVARKLSTDDEPVSRQRGKELLNETQRLLDCNLSKSDLPPQP
jgi:hypothetical protein